MLASNILAYGVLGAATGVLARVAWFHFWNWVDDVVAEAFADRREKPRQQVTDARYAVTPWGDIAWPVDARCPVDFVEGKTGAEVFDRAGERAKSGTGLLGNDSQTKVIQTQNSNSIQANDLLQTRRQNRAGQVR